MSWGRFITLLTALHPDGVLSLMIQHDKKIEAENRSVSPQDVMRMF